MKNQIITLLFISIVLVTGCKPSHEKSVSRINVMEKNLFSPDVVSFNKEKSDSLVAFYMEFIQEYPQDSLSAGYLFKAANLAMNAGDGKKALLFFDQYIQDYPGKSKAAMCMFFKAFVYENLMHDLDKARETYTIFIEKYPSNDFTKDAKLALQNLGKTPEMIVREFEARAKADSARRADSLAKMKKTRKR
ncbi:MAG: tetratricopeptide repeat protein [Bacteroidales bacterium]